MKISTPCHVAALVAVTAFAGTARAQDITVDAAYRQTIVSGTISNLKNYYVFPDVADQMAAALTRHVQNGDYNSITSAFQFANQLTADLYAVAHDKHIHVNYAYKGFAQANPGGGPSPSDIDQFEKSRNYAISAAQRLPGNIGYLRVDGFLDPSSAAEAIAAAMNFLQHTEALLIDVRYNGGGRPEGVAALESYLFDQKTLVNQIYFRDTNSTTSYYTSDTVPGKRYSHKDVYVITSRNTISGGEELPYDLQALKRAIVVGEVTAGGANPGGFQRIDDNFAIFVPSGRAINPVTGANWEGAGVQPDIQASADSALWVAQLTALRKLASDGTYRPPPMVADMESTIAQLQQQVNGTICPTPDIQSVTDENYGQNVRSNGVAIVWGQGFAEAGGNSLRFVQGQTTITLDEKDGLYFWDQSSTQINAAVGSRVSPGRWQLVAGNACGNFSNGFPIVIH
jgi:hypothetical protein